MHRLLSVCSNLGLQVPTLPNLVVTLDDDDQDDDAGARLVPLTNDEGVVGGTNNTGGGGNGDDDDDDDCQITDVTEAPAALAAAGSTAALAWVPNILGQISGSASTTSMGSGQQQQQPEQQQQHLHGPSNPSSTSRSSLRVGHPSSDTSVTLASQSQRQQTPQNSQSQSQSTADEQQHQVAHLRTVRTPKQLSKLLNANKQLVAARKRQLMEMPQVDLAKLCFQQTVALKRQQVSNTKQNNQIRCLKRKISKLEKDVQKQANGNIDNSDATFQVCKRGKQRSGRGGRFTVSSWFSIGIRKGLTQIAASDFGLATMCDVSGQTVMRSEARTGAGIIYLFQLFVAEALDYSASCGRTTADQTQTQTFFVDADAVASGSETISVVCEIPALVESTSLEFSIVAVGFRNDATNTNIWRRQKLNVTEASVVWIKDFDKLTAFDWHGARDIRHCTHLG